MGHLSLETLGRLIDEQPAPDEREHLASCLHCTAELADMRDQVESLGSLPDVRPPKGDWDVLEARLVSEGFIHKKSWFPFKSVTMTPAWMQVAAGMVLFLGGMGLGATVVRQHVAEPSAMTTLADLMPIESPGEHVDLGLAEDAVRLAEQQYMDALLQYRALRNASEDGYQPADPAGRFAALDAIVATSQAAVRQSPTDPFLNGILISAMAEREAALRRVAGTDEWY